MRFFSNDKDSRDDQPAVEVQERVEQAPDQPHGEHPERVSSDPVSVPQQRPGSPWSSTPDAPEATGARPVTPGQADSGIEFHEPAPQPTAFGASTVGGAVAASAMANPQNDTWSATARDSAADSFVGDDRTVAPGDGVVHDRAGAAGDRVIDNDAPVAGTRPADVVDVALDDQGNFDDPHVRGADSGTREDPTPPDARRTDIADGGTDGAGGGAVAGTAAAGTLAGATVAGAAAGRRDDDRTGTHRTDTGRTDAGRDTVLKDDGTFEAPRAVDPATERPLDGQSAPGTVPVAAASTSAVSPATGSLFDRDDATSFQERWRDVQLRFVDSPKEATAEAAGLLDEAVDRLAASLRAQKNRLAGDGTEDTEKLRIELRGYRDMLNRLLDL